MSRLASILALTAVSLLPQESGAGQAENSLPGPSSIYRQALTFQDDTGAEVALDRWRGRTIVMAMTFTTCTATCPTTLRKLREIEKAFGERGRAVEFVIVSLNPSYDTPFVLAKYRRREQVPVGTWHLLTGGETQTRMLARQLGLDGYWKMDPDHVIHDFRISLVDPRGEVTKSLDWDHRDVATLFEEAPPGAAAPPANSGPSSP